MVAIDIEYQGQLHCVARHEPSGARLQTDAPVDNHGRGEAFSSTDLVAAALGTCMATVMGIVADKRGWSLDGMRLRVHKHMVSKPERRVARLEVQFAFPVEVAAALGPPDRKILERAAETCPVRLSILPAIEVPIDFAWDGN